MYDRELVQKKILALIEHYGADSFKDKKILDLGAGHGEIAIALTNLGAVVTCVDARKQHLDSIRGRNHTINCIRADLDLEWPFRDRFWLTVHFGTLNHLKYVEKHLKLVCGQTKHLAIDSQVCDSSDSTKCVLVKENKGNQYQSYNGIGCRPSPEMIERILADSGMHFDRVVDNRCNSKQTIYDWYAKNSGAIKDGISRMWFASQGNPDWQSDTVRSAPQPVQPVVTPFIPKFIPNMSAAFPTAENFKKTQQNEITSSARTAICISGHMRSFEQTFGRLDSLLIKPNNCDIFISTWNVAGFDQQHGDGGLVSKFITDDMLIQRYSPKKFVIEPMRKFGGEKYMKHAMAVRNPENVLGMFYKIKSANELKSAYEKENGFVYDYVVRCRTDMLFERILNVTKYNRDRITLIKDFRWGGENDKFAFGNSSIMDLYSSLFDYIDQYWADGCVFHPETMLRYHIQQSNIPHSWETIPYSLQRGDGSTIRI